MLARGWTVIHLLALANRQEASLTPGALVEPDGTIAYPVPQHRLLP
jgi:hypothetical protein